ncbi:uncharacterized protein [Ambystoma mexicanum]|uniref:uncharacterized protein n=1 Tax=Ambystoma mexicanum TaxID=8296 RepID=UPI0037E965BD
MCKILQDNGLTLNGPKCAINKHSLRFFGHMFSEKGIKADPDKVNAILGLEAPKDVAELQSFLEMTGYCARYLPRYAMLTDPLRQLLKKDVAFVWDENCKAAFETIKNELTSDRQLACFNPVC